MAKEDLAVQKKEKSKVSGIMGKRLDSDARNFLVDHGERVSISH